MLPIPHTGEIIMIALLVFIVFFGEKVGAIGDAIGRMRERSRRNAGSKPNAGIDDGDRKGG